MKNSKPNSYEPLSLIRNGGGSIIGQAPICMPNGKSILIVRNESLHSYSIASGEQISEYCCVDPVVNAGFNPNNPEFLLACTDKGKILCWKWKTELLISENILNVELKQVNTFHVLSWHESYKQEDCEMLISWTTNEKNQLGIFTSADCKLKKILPIKLKSKHYSIHIGGKFAETFIAVIEQQKMKCINIAGKVVKMTIGKKRRFTCVACHPEQICVATGDSSGRILLWQNLFGDDNPTQTMYHWHTLPVRCLAFSCSGGEMYSGGNECVVVKWRLDCPLDRKYLPRLPAPIKHLVVGSKNMYLTISMDDNEVRLVDAQFLLKSNLQHLVWGAPFPAGLLFDPASKALVLNGHPGHLQFYLPETKSLLYNLDIVGQNQISNERDRKIHNTQVMKMAVAKGGQYFATVEQRPESDYELRLKFWQFDTKNRTHVLNTSVEMPHEGCVFDLAFQPTTETTMCCVTTGDDSCFKVWHLVNTSDIYKKSSSWNCAYIGNYKSLSAGPLSFSVDGSLLAVSFGCCLTLWVPDSCEMKASLVHSTYKAPLHLVQFGNADQQHLVVTANTNYLCAWNLLTMGLLWSVPVNLKMMCADPRSSYIAAITEKNDLFVFQPNCPNPVYNKTDMCKANENIMAVVFMPHELGPQYTPLPWQKNSQLYFINSNQELISLEVNGTKDSAEIEYTPHSEKSAFAALLAQSITRNTSNMNGSNLRISGMETGLSGAMTFKELVTPPVHTMAPMRLLCGSVLRSVIQGCKVNDPSINLDDDEDVSEFTEASAKTSGSDSDSETPRRRLVVRPEIIEDDANEQSTKNLQNVFKESTSWTSILV